MNLTCSNINNTLLQISAQSPQLWGLSNYNNSHYCGIGQQLFRIVTFQDFESNLSNPLYQSEVGTNYQNMNDVFLPVCYAYSILRIFMVISVAVYVTQKMEEIFNQSKELPAEKQTELQFYKRMMQTSLILEIICGVRDFFFFKGTLLYSNLMNEDSVQCYIDIYNNGNMTCNTANQTVINNWRPFSYSRTECNCLYYQPTQVPYMLFSVIFWIITESLTQGVMLLTVHILSRLNKMERSGWNFITPSLIRTILYTLFFITFYSVLIFQFQMLIYYRFLNIGVVGYYLFQKCFIFIMIFERLYSKIWLELKLRLPTLHASGIAWSKTLSQLKKQIDKPVVMPEDIQEKDQQKYRKQYQDHLEGYYQEVIFPKIDKYEKEYNAKMKTQWYDYLNYLLTINLIGIVGYIFIFSYWLSDNKVDSLFWIGFILALIELIVFEVSNVVFQLHCFLIELYKQCKEECSAIESQENISALNE